MPLRRQRRKRRRPRNRDGPMLTAPARTTDVRRVLQLDRDSRTLAQNAGDLSENFAANSSFDDRPIELELHLLSDTDHLFGARRCTPLGRPSPLPPRWPARSTPRPGGKGGRLMVARAASRGRARSLRRHAVPLQRRVGRRWNSSLERLRLRPRRGAPWRNRIRKARAARLRESVLLPPAKPLHSALPKAQHPRTRPEHQAHEPSRGCDFASQSPP